MDANTIDLTKLFSQSVQYEVPMFQRPYVWNEDEHWDPLWGDIESLLLDRGKGSEHPHFLGAVVLDQVATTTADVDRRQIIDGQQRLTTLQLLLAAARDEAEARGLDRQRGLLARLVENDEYVVRSDADLPKVWPTRSDQGAFLATMRGEEADKQSPLTAGYKFFRAAIAEWLDEGDGSVEDHFQELVTTVTRWLRVVVIDLDARDDAQVIFETLNARGTPLEAADLIKNFLFDQAGKSGHDVEQLHDHVWSPFLDDYWRESVRQGRLIRSRIDIFINHYLAMRMTREVISSKLFAAFKNWYETTGDAPDVVMEDMERYGSVFSAFDSHPTDSREAVFFQRLSVMDTTAAHPFLLWLFGLVESRLSVEERHETLDALESFLVRRLVCRLTAKNYNRFFLGLLSSVREAEEVAEAVETYLLASDAPTSRWPADAEVMTRLIDSRVYGNIRRDRIQMVLAAVSEEAGDDRLTEAIRIDGNLTVEHLMPQRWEAHWPINGDHDARERRGALIDTIGNLTLITQSLNSKISNGPWADKRATILEHSALPINRQLPEDWDEDRILERSRQIAAAVTRVWARPPVEHHSQFGSEDVSVPDLPIDVEHDGSTARGVILDAFARLESRTGQSVFELAQVVDEVLGYTDRYPAKTLRTHVVSHMCIDAPNHYEAWRDLRRVDRGLYRRSVSKGSVPAAIDGSKPDAYLEFWKRHLARRRAEHPGWPGKASPTRQGWVAFPSGLPGTALTSGFAAGSRLRSELAIDCGDKERDKELFAQLSAMRPALEHEYGSGLEFEELPDVQMSRIAAYLGDSDVLTEADHEAYVEWFLDNEARWRRALLVVDLERDAAPDVDAALANPITSGESRDPTDLEAVFHEAMVDIVRQARSEASYNPTRFAQMIAENGGLAAAHQLLAGSGVSGGFATLWEAGRLDLSVEAHALKPEFRELFSAWELETASRRLREYGWSDD